MFSPAWTSENSPAIYCRDDWKRFFFGKKWIVFRKSTHQIVKAVTQKSCLLQKLVAKSAVCPAGISKTETASLSEG